MNKPTEFATTLQNYFYQWLIEQQNVSTQTVKSYRGTFRLLFDFTKCCLHRPASQLCLEDINAELIIKFLKHLEKNRKNTIRTRNARLAAIRSFMNYISYQMPAMLPMVQQILAIPMKRFDRPLVGYLTREEIEAILVAPDSSTWTGNRDRVLFATLYNTGARVSEIASLLRSGVELNKTPIIRLQGKGRKERIIPIWKSTEALIKQWLNKVDANKDGPLFPNHYGKAMTRSGIENRLDSAIKIASLACPSLKKKKITPHIIRHTTAMHLLQSGVDLTVIALWLGHESIVTTHHYIEADLKIKKEALNNIQEPENKITSPYRCSDKLLAFLDNL
jgi:site-specific recombinase XerD